MTNYNNHSNNCTTFFPNYQLFLPMDIGVVIPALSPVRVISKVLEGLDYSNLLQVYSNSKGRKHKIDADKMFFILAYAMFDGVTTTRTIEKNCRENINYMWILRGSKAPDHNTISRFIVKYRKEIEELFYQLVNRFIQIEEIDMENIFIDETKIEANANRYSFVWKRAVNNFYDKLKLKANEFWAEYNEENGKFFNNIYEIEEYIEKEIKEKNIKIKSGRGNRKTKLKKDYEICKEYMEKESEYKKHIEICGSRNSYSKTDKDATFMRLKDDHMKNGQLKPAYNLQIGVNSEYIVGLELFPNPTDVKTLVPFLSLLEEKNLKFKNIIADAGYESEENYEYLFNNNYEVYIKPQNYEKKKTKKYKNDVSKVENMRYDEKRDVYICLNNRYLNYLKRIEKKNESGYISKKEVYECESCSGCPYANKCKKAKGNRKLYIAKRFMEYRKNSEKNIKSEKGKELRLNRSIQVEGAFGVFKQNMGMKRFKYKTKEKAKTEIILFAIGYNLRKYINKLNQKREKTRLHRVKVS